MSERLPQAGECGLGFLEGKMKASVKRRDGEEALLRAKIPLNILGMPVCSGVTMGSSEELGLHLSTLFTSGPACRVMFMPNDSYTPFSFTVKAGIGPWGSPIGSSFVISAQLKLPATSQSPCFSFSVKPRLGDFSLCKSLKGIRLPEHGSGIRTEEIPSKPVSVAELAKVFDKEEDEKAKLNLNGLKNGHVKGFDDDWDKKAVKTTPSLLLKDWRLTSHGSLPLGQNITARIRWQVGIPGDCVEALASDPHRLFTRLSLPVLSLDKISFHRTEPAGEPGVRKNSGNKTLASKGTRLVSAEAAQWIEENEELNKVAAMCSSIRRQLHLVYSENQVLRSTMEEMKLKFNRSVPSGTLEKPEMMESIPGPGIRQPQSRKESFMAREKDKSKAPASTLSQKKEEQSQHKSKAPASTPTPKKEEKAPGAPVDTSQIAKELKKALGSGK